MKKLLLISLAVASITACSTDATPTPQKLGHNIEAISANTVISVISEDSYQVPKEAQIIEKSGLYRTIDNIYDEMGQQVLIPRNAIISGTYTNDGMNCKIHWKSVYVNKDEYKHNHGSFSLGYLTSASVCDPMRGIKSGDRLTINFTAEAPQD